MMKVIEQQTAMIQACYPEIYFACHVDHRSGDSTGGALSARDGSLLAHIAGLDGCDATRLARHLGRAKSTLSPALKKFEAMGLIAVHVPAGDARRKCLRITAAGRRIISGTSVLERGRLCAVLELMPAEDRQQAVKGMELIAAACRAFMAKEGTAW
jgi:DNA-binding MarR family transcriptional regulator